MSEVFNPYYTWLGIPPEEQPANHYRLLGLKVFEANPDVISNASDQRVAHLRTVQVGKNGALGQKVINEIFAATACLLSPEKKKAYDQALQQKLAPQPKAIPQAKRILPQAAPVTPAPVALPTAAPVAVQPPAVPVNPLPTQPLPTNTPAIQVGPSGGFQASRALSKSKGLSVPVIGTIAFVAVASIVIVVISLGQKPAEIAQVTPKANVADPKGKAEPASTTKQPAVDVSPMPPVPAANVSPQEATAPPATPMPAPIAETKNAITPPPAIEPAPSINSPPTATPPVTPPVVAAGPAPAGPPPIAPPVDPTAATAPAPLASPGESLIPPEEELARARKQLIEAFGADAQKATDPELKRALAEKLLKLGEETKDDQAARYVLVDNARKLFAGAGDVIASLATADKLADWFQIDPEGTAKLRQATFVSLSDSPLPGTSREELADRIAEELTASIVANRFAAADEFSMLGLKVTRALKDQERKKVANQQRTLVTKLKTDLARYDQAKVTLATNPNDGPAHLVAAKFACNVLNDWKEGLTHLAAGGDGTLAEIVRLDQQASEMEENFELQFQAADAWFDWSEKYKAADRELVSLAKARAVFWYQLVSPKLTGLNKIRADKRVADLAPATGGTVSRPPPQTAVATAPKTTKKPIGKAENKKSSQPTEPPVPGLRGLIFVEGRQQSILVSYENAASLNQKHFDELLSPIRKNNERVVIVFEGFVVIPAPGDYIFQISGGSNAGGVHTLFVGGQNLVSVTDSDNETRRLTLDKGEYPIRWELAGGAHGSALLHMQLPQNSPVDAPRPTLATSAKQLAALKAVTKTEASLGPAPRK